MLAIFKVVGIISGNCVPVDWILKNPDSWVPNSYKSGFASPTLKDSVCRFFSEFFFFINAQFVLSQGFIHESQNLSNIPFKIKVFFQWYFFRQFSLLSFSLVCHLYLSCRDSFHHLHEQVLLRPGLLQHLQGIRKQHGKTHQNKI